MTSEKRRAARVFITIELTADLAEWEVWPDGDAPEGWTARHVAELIATEHGMVSSLIREWGLDVYATVEVGDDAGGHVTVDYPGAQVEER